MKVARLIKKHRFACFVCIAGLKIGTSILRPCKLRQQFKTELFNVQNSGLKTNFHHEKIFISSLLCSLNPWFSKNSHSGS